MAMYTWQEGATPLLQVGDTVEIILTVEGGVGVVNFWRQSVTLVPGTVLHFSQVSKFIRQHYHLSPHCFGTLSDRGTIVVPEAVRLIRHSRIRSVDKEHLMAGVPLRVWGVHPCAHMYVHALPQGGKP